MTFDANIVELFWKELFTVTLSVIDSYLLSLFRANFRWYVDCLRLDNESRQYFQHSRITAIPAIAICVFIYVYPRFTAPPIRSIQNSAMQNDRSFFFYLVSSSVCQLYLRPLPTSYFLPYTHTTLRSHRRQKSVWNKITPTAFILHTKHETTSALLVILWRFVNMFMYPSHTTGAMPKWMNANCELPSVTSAQLVEDFRGVFLLFQYRR